MFAVSATEQRSVTTAAHRLQKWDGGVMCVCVCLLLRLCETGNVCVYV